MPRTRTPYPADFRDQIVALARTGRSIEDLAREFEPSWVKQADRDGGRRTDGLTSEERANSAVFAGRTASYARREISWQRPRPGLLRATRCRLGLRIDDGKPGHPNQDHEQNPRRIKVRLAWRDRSPSARSIADAALTDRIKAIHADSRATYGAIHAELVDEGVQVGRKRIERLMKATAVSRRKAARTTFRDERVRPACDLVDRNFYLGR